jgi:CII-binding regulator of phage lambda lysogenization HflD
MTVQNAVHCGNCSTWTDLPPEIRRRLELAGVRSAAQWRRLGDKRLQIFGIIPTVQRQLDELARGAA